MKVKNYKNGATLIYRHFQRKHTSVSAGFIFGDNRDKYPEPTAHFCEHMFFKESKKMTQFQLVKKRNKIFSLKNGRTGFKFTCIDFCRSNKILEPCFDFSSEVLLNTHFLKKHVESEKGVIKQELTKRLNDPLRKLEYATYRTIRDHLNSDYSILGSFEEIDKMDVETLKKFHNECFISQNFFICISGGISYFRAKKLAEKYFIKRLKSNPKKKSEKTIEIKNNKPGNMNIEYFPLEKSWCNISIKVESELETTKSQTIIDLLTKVSNSTVGLIGLTLRNSGLVYKADIVGGQIRKNNSFLSLNFECSSENVNKIIDVLSSKLCDFANSQITQELIEEQKNKRKYEKDEEIQKNIYPNKDYFLYFQNNGNLLTKKYEKEYNKEFNSLTSNDIQEFIKTILSKPENLYVTILSNKGPENFYTYEQMQKKLMCPKLKTK